MPERYEVEAVVVSEISKGDRVWWQSEEEWATVSAEPRTYRQFGDRGPTRVTLVLGGDPTNWQPDEVVPRVVAARVGTEDELSSLLARLEGFLCERRRESPEHAFLYREVKTALAARAASSPEEGEHG